jgi:UDP-N-acetylglucosamine--N-acetylmuramyl-(pentapeptide) pyrophosphoryl-undecaprenol N-acetylglucosamine transferase
MSTLLQSPIILAAGGTGGHIFPAEALARTLVARGYQVVLITDQRGGRFGDDLNIAVHRIQAASLGGNPLRLPSQLLRLGMGYLQARRLLKRMRPEAVVGFGGYPSVPTLLAAAALGIPIVLHEQNAILGRANRLLIKPARLIATGFPRLGGLGDDAKITIVHTGNPVRPAFLTLREASHYPPITAESELKIFVMGGSQGASIFSEIVPRALALLPQDLRRRIRIAQQCRAEDMRHSQAAYAAAGIEPELATFFRDVPERLARCHLTICRAGASTIAELAMLGRPAILVPYPFGHVGEQRANAEGLAEAGGAWVIPQDAFMPEALAVRLESLLTHPTLLSKTAAAALAYGIPHAADNLADQILNIIGQR